MTTSYSIISSITVPENYSWDDGNPFGTTTSLVTGITNSGYVIGYAPGVKITFQNRSTDDEDFDFVEYTWNFNDYYNSLYNNIPLSCKQNVTHTFIMPGEYTVSLKHYQTKTVPVLVDSGLPTLSCLGKYDIEWYWDNLSATNICRTWFETECNASFEKTWDDELACLGRFCKFWSWTQLEKQGGVNPVTWEQTKTEAEFTKRWLYEPPTTVCSSGEDATFIDVQQVQEQTYKPSTITVRVLEIKPTANIYSITQPTTGITPYTIELTPKETKSGSFPIDRIVWDPGDGSGFKTVTRLEAPDAHTFTFTNYFSTDPLDPRNYNLLHTYKRGLKTYPIFYPSLTAFSSSTDTYDTCSTTIGPIVLSSISGQTHLLGVRNSSAGKLYSIQTQDYVSFMTTQTATNTQEYAVTTPDNPIKPVILKVQTSYGNNGAGYPEQSIFVC